jgi:DNA helicase II / ATP-dependent DNA helicase PcrA
MAEDGLNDPQRRAVAHVRGPLLVFAGAGSGKTRVITYRIANMVACERIPPYRILAVTFTNKAAGEMRSRLEGLLGPAAKDLWVGTFHATCAKLLRRHAEAVGLSPSFVIYDSQDQKSLMTRVLRDLKIDEKRYPPRMVLGMVHKEKQEARGPDEMGVNGYADETARRAYARYEEALRAANAVDFEDLILLTLRLLEANEDQEPRVLDARDALRGKFDYVLVDEFQDTNTTQYRLLRQFAGRTGNLCVVGDDDQSIYRWRGADVRNIRGFRKDYPNAEVVKLEQNYRSTQRIVAAALAVISPSKEREPKELWTNNDDGSKVAVFAVADERDEGAHVARMVMDARGVGIPPKEIAIFYRVHAQSRVIEESLRAANVPYQIIGGTKFYDRAEVKDALSYLRLLVNPKSDVDFLRVVNTPPRGIGNTTVERLAQYASQAGIPLSAALGHMEEIPEIAAAARKRLGQFQQLLSLLAQEAKDAAPAQVLEAVLSKTGYRAQLRAEDNAESDARMENLAELEGSIHDYEDEAKAAGDHPTLTGFLERVSLQSDTDNIGAEERVTLMTVHGAKGLEFDLVILTGMEEDMFPYRSMEGRGEGEMEEERRLGYVAVTRAKKHLIMVHARQRQIFGTTRVGSPSRFIVDIPQDLIDFHASPAARNAGEQGRYVDRSRGPAAARPASVRPGGFRHPMDRPSAGDASVSPHAASPQRQAGERFVEREESAHDSADFGDVQIRRGTKVLHKRFGEGEVRKVIELGEPAVIAFFPGWGEVKVLARFLQLA